MKRSSREVQFFFDWTTNKWWQDITFQQEVFIFFFFLTRKNFKSNQLGRQHLQHSQNSQSQTKPVLHKRLNPKRIFFFPFYFISYFSIIFFLISIGFTQKWNLFIFLRNLICRNMQINTTLQGSLLINWSTPSKHGINITYYERNRWINITY